MLPLNLLDGGNTDNTGVCRAVMQGATHLSVLAFGILDFRGLFQNNGIEIKSANMCVYSDIFKCSEREQGYLKKIIYDDESTNHMSDSEIKREIENDILANPEAKPNFTFVERKTYYQSNEQQKFLKKMFLCKFRDLQVNLHPHYFDLKTIERQDKRMVKEFSIAFGLPTDYGLQRGALENDFSNYGPFCDEIFASIQNGFVENFESGQVSGGGSNIAEAKTFQKFIF